MPIVSQAQQRAMYAAAAGNSNVGIPKSVGQDFVAAGPAGGSFAKLPAKKSPSKKKMGPKMRSAISRGMMPASKAADLGYDVTE